MGFANSGGLLFVDESAEQVASRRCRRTVAFSGVGARPLGGRTWRGRCGLREKIRPLLRFARSRGRLAGMPALAVLYPSPALAEIADPRVLAAEVGGREAPVARAAVLALARKRVAAALAPVLARHVPRERATGARHAQRRCLRRRGPGQRARMRPRDSARTQSLARSSAPSVPTNVSQ